MVDIAHGFRVLRPSVCVWVDITHGLRVLRPPVCVWDNIAHDPPEMGAMDLGTAAAHCEARQLVAAEKLWGLFRAPCPGPSPAG